MAQVKPKRWADPKTGVVHSLVLMVAPPVSGASESILTIAGWGTVCGQPRPEPFKETKQKATCIVCLARSL